MLYNNWLLIPLKQIAVSLVIILMESGAFAFNLGLIDYEERIEIERTIM